MPRADRASASEVDGARPARGLRPRAAGRGARRPRRSRSCCTPAARTSRSCAASGSTDVTNVFDTQVAAGFAGFSRAGRLHRAAARRAADPRRQDRELHALGRAAADRGAALLRARGRRAPAAAGRRASRSACARSGRLEWAREECRAIAEATDERDPEEVWRRLPRAGGLDPRERAVARELAAWRERTAAREDRPVGSILRDPTLVELAKRQPAGRARAGPDPRPQPRRRAPPRRRPARGDRARPRRARRSGSRRASGCTTESVRRTGDRARRGAGARPRAGGRARLRADRRARRPRRRSSSRRGAATRSPTCARCRAGAASSSARSCSSCSPGGAVDGRRGRVEVRDVAVEADAASLREARRPARARFRSRKRDLDFAMAPLGLWNPMLLLQRFWWEGQSRTSQSCGARKRRSRANGYGAQGKTNATSREGRRQAAPAMGAGCACPERRRRQVGDGHGARPRSRSSAPRRAAKWLPGVSAGASRRACRRWPRRG